MSQIQKIYRNLSVQLLNSKNENNEILDYSSQADIATSTQNYNEDNMQENGEDEQTEDDGAEPLVEDELENQEFYNLDYSYPQSKYNQINQQRSQMSQRTSIDLKCDKCTIACEMIQKRDNQIKKLLEKVQRYKNDLQKQRIQEEVLNISLQKKQQSIDEKDRLIAQLSRKIHYFNTQTKIQSNQKQQAFERPQTQQAISYNKMKQSSITQQYDEQKIKKRKVSSIMDKMKTVQLVQQEVLNLKQSCVTKSQQAKAGEKLATVLQEIQQKRSSVQSQILVNFNDTQIKDSLQKSQINSKLKKEDCQQETHRSNLIQEEEINLPRQLYQGIDQQRKKSPMMQIEEEKKSEDEMNTSIYMEYKVPQKKNQNQNHLNFFQNYEQNNSQQQKQTQKNQNVSQQNVSTNSHQSNFQKIRQMVEQRNQNKSQLFRQSSKLSQSGNNYQENRQGSDAHASDQIEQKNSLTAAKKETQQKIVVHSSSKNNSLIHNMPAMKGTHLEDQFHFQIQKKMQFQSTTQSNQDIDLIDEQNKKELVSKNQTASDNNQKQYEMPLQIADKKVQIISDSEEIQESQKRPNKPINRSEYGMGGRLSNRLSQCEQKELISNDKNEMITSQNQSLQISIKKKLENTIHNPILNQISDDQIIEQKDQSKTQLMNLQIKLDQFDPTSILLSSQPCTTKSQIKIANGISNSTARNNRLLGSNSRQIQDMMNSVMRRPKLDQTKNYDDEIQNSLQRQQRGLNDQSVKRKGESAKSKVAGVTERLGETDRDLMLDIDEEISKDSMTLPNKSMILYSQIITHNRQIKNHFIKNTQSFVLQNKYLSKEVETVLENKNFLKNLIQNKKKIDFDQVDIDRFEEQKVMNSDNLSGIQKSKNSFLIKNSNKTISRQHQQSPFNKISEYTNERVMQTFQAEKNNITISDLQLDQTLQNTGNKNFTISGVLKRQQQQQVIVNKNKNQGKGYNNPHSSRNSLTNISLTRLQSCAFSTNQKQFAHFKIQSSITRSEQKKNTSVISSKILKKKLQVNINSTERSQQNKNIAIKDSSTLLKHKNQISDDSQKSSEIKKDFCNTFRTIKSNLSLNRSKSKRNQLFVKSLQSQDIQQLKSGKLSTSQPKNFQKTNSLLVQGQHTQNSEFNQKVILTGLNQSINSKADNDLKIFDDFMIVGLDDNRFQNHDELIEIQNVKQRKEILFHFKNIIIDDKIKIYESLRPESIWSFTHNQNQIEKCSRRKVIKNFCFPEGVKIAKISSLKQIEDGILVNYGINKIKNENDQKISKQDDQEPFLQFGDPFLFIFTLNKEEQIKKLKKKYIEERKVTQVEQDMVMPGLPQITTQNFQYRPSSKAERDISHLNSQQTSNLRSQITDTNYNEDDQLDQNFDGFNSEPFMYCLCLRFDVLILKKKQEKNHDTNKLQESLDTQNNLQNQIQNRHISKKDLIDLIKNENVYITQEAFCCMFSNHQMFDIIGQFMMKLYQLFCLQINDKIRSNDYSGLFSLSRENNFNSELKLIIQEMNEIQLHPSLRGKDAQIQMIQFGKSIQSLLKNRCSGRRHFIEKGNNFNNYISSISRINFFIQLTNEEIVFQQFQIFYESIFKLMSSNDIVNLIKAILLEKTIIFVGDEHMLAQFILGFNSLISPFKWCFSLIPILPVDLIDMLEAPVPLIVGITPFEYQLLMQENILENEMDQKIWVHIKLNEITISNKVHYLPIKIQNLQSQLDQYLIDENHSIYDPETCNFGNLCRTLEEIHEKNVGRKVEEIQKVIGKIVSKDIIEKLQEEILFAENEDSDQELKRLVQKCDYITRQFHHDKTYYQNNKWGDYEFINQFTKTQIFATLMDQFIDNKKNQQRQSII